MRDEMRLDERESSLAADAAAARERPVGWLVVEGREFPVARLEMRGGQIMVVAVRTLDGAEELTLPASSTFELLGLDRRLVLAGRWDDPSGPATAKQDASPTDGREPAWMRVELPLRLRQFSLFEEGWVPPWRS